jgi:uncharacterized protein
MRVLLHVRAGQRRQSVGGVAGGALAVRVKAPAVDSKANAATLELVAEAFGVRVRQVRLMMGRTSPRKLVEIDIDPEQGRRREAELRSHPVGRP